MRDFNIRELKLLQQALQYSLVNSKSEAETAEFGLMLVDIEKRLANSKT